MSPITPAASDEAAVRDVEHDLGGAGHAVDRRDSTHVNLEQSDVPLAQRAALLGQRPVTLWLTGLSASGKSTLARAVERKLASMRRPVYVLDGDNLRQGLSRDLGFSPRDRSENIRRVAEVARMMNEAGLIVVTAFISPYREDRERARRVIGVDRFIEAYLSADLATCERRDPRGLYRKARNGLLPDFTGVSAPYEPPLQPHVALDTGVLDVDSSVAVLLERVLAASTGERGVAR